MTFEFNEVSCVFLWFVFFFSIGILFVRDEFILCFRKKKFFVLRRECKLILGIFKIGNIIKEIIKKELKL